MKQNLLIALSLTVINFIAKYAFLNHSSFYLDEAYSVYYAQQSLEGLSVIFEKEANPPSYFLTLHYWIQLFGISEAATRALSLLFSSLSVGAVFLLFRSKMNVLPSLFMALSLAFSSTLFFYGNEVRVHAMSAFAGLMSVYFLYQTFATPNLKTVLLHSISLAVLLYLHYANGILIAVELLAVSIYFTYKQLWRLLPFYAVSAILSIPLFISITLTKIQSTASWLSAPKLNEIWLMWYQLSNDSVLMSWLFIIVPIIGLLFIKDLKSWLIFSMPFLYIILAFLVSQFVPLFLEKYLLTAIILMVVGVAELISKIQIKHGSTALSLVFAVLMLASVKPKTDKGVDWRGAANFVRLSGPDTEVLVSPVFMYRPYLYYADRDEFSKAGNIFSRCFKKGMYFADKIDTVFFEHIDPKTLIYISKNPVNDPNLSLLNKRFSLGDERWFGGLHAFVFEK